MKKKFVDDNYYVYSNLCDKHKNVKIINKEILKNNPKLLIVNNQKQVHKINNIQTLYLYPLTLLDYATNLSVKKILSLNIIKISKKLDYVKLFTKTEFNDIKAVEILIDKLYGKEEYQKICQIIEILHKKQIKITLNIKDLCRIKNYICDYYKYIDYFKVFLPNILNTIEYDRYLRKLNRISSLKNKNALFHIKTYLDISQVDYYKNALDDLIKLNVDVFQVSKELIPINTKNVMVDKEVIDKIRYLEKEYDDFKNTKFISVKDLSTLYYPRFELDERNSRKCYACYMKPYLYKNLIIPCKVNKVFENISEWSISYDELSKYEKIVSKCGVNCSDCASIFENDILYEIENIINNDIGYSFYLELGDNND